MSATAVSIGSRPAILTPVPKTPTLFPPGTVIPEAAEELMDRLLVG